MNPYDVLGVPRDATKKQINEAFRTKSKAAHPDAGGTAEEFIKLKRAHDTLADDEKRKKFDSYGVVDGDNDAEMLRNAALHFITAVFINMIDQDSFSDLRGLDVLQCIKEASLDSLCDLVRRKDKMDSDIAKSRKQLAAVEQRMKLKAETGKNIFTDIIQRRITSMESDLVPIKKGIEVMQEVERIAAQYEQTGGEAERDIFSDMVRQTYTTSGPKWTRRTSF